jgi:alpha-beta hydrolase superfamily lysophospholipase
MVSVQTQQFNGHQIATAFHDGGADAIVIFCHGYRGTCVGPSRSFVTAANGLKALGISSLRIDQYGSGNSDGDFVDSRFDDWVATTTSIAREYLGRGFKVALFGQSMGASAVIVAGAQTPAISAVVAWVPDPSIDEFVPPANGIIEEGGQVVHADFWQQAHDADISAQLATLAAPAYIVQCTGDAFVDANNRDAIATHAQTHHTVATYEGMSHSAWTHAEFVEIVGNSVEFLARELHRK